MSGRPPPTTGAGGAAHTGWGREGGGAVWIRGLPLCALKTITTFSVRNVLRTCRYGYIIIIFTRIVSSVITTTTTTTTTTTATNRIRCSSSSGSVRLLAPLCCDICQQPCARLHLGCPPGRHYYLGSLLLGWSPPILLAGEAFGDRLTNFNK